MFYGNEKKSWEPSWDFDFNWINIIWRPWWHLECSAMEQDILWLPFDIHTWWKDLKFPHHEDEIAQSMIWYWILKNNYFVHNWYLLVDWEKMSKSKWNFYTIKELIKKKWFDAEDIRFTLSTSHHLNDFSFTDNWVHASKRNLEYIRETLEKIQKHKNESVKELSWDIVKKFELEFKKAMEDDLSVWVALSVILEFLKELNILMDKWEVFNTNWALEFLEKASFVFWVSFKKKEIIIPEDVINLAEQRQKAKDEKNFSLADVIRWLIEKKWFFIKDSEDWYLLEKK